MNGIPTVEIDGVPDPLPEGLAVLDVREDFEWEAGHIEGALHIPMQEVPGRLADVPVDGQVLVVCKVGGRSARVTAYLQAQGVDAVNLADGMLGWQAAGRRIVTDSSTEPYVL